MTREVSLSVNETPIALDYFVEKFIYHVVDGMVAALEGTGDIGSLNLAIEDDGQVTINLNNVQVPTNLFVSKIINSTMVGMVSTLKGVSEIKRLNLAIRR